MCKYFYYRYARLKDEIEDNVSQIETGSVIVVDFQNDLRTAANKLAELEDELDRMSPIGRDTDTVHAQINEIKAFNGKLYEKQELVEELNKQAEDLVVQGYMSPDDPRYTQMETLQKQHTRLGKSGNDNTEIQT